MPWSYLPNTKADRQEMLNSIGVKTANEKATRAAGRDGRSRTCQAHAGAC